MRENSNLYSVLRCKWNLGDEMQKFIQYLVIDRK